MNYHLPPNPIYEARNATGAPYRSDGRLLVIFLSINVWSSRRFQTIRTWVQVMSLFNCITTTYSLSCSADFLHPSSKFHSALTSITTHPLIRHKQGPESMASGLLGPREGLEQPKNSCVLSARSKLPR